MRLPGLRRGPSLGICCWMALFTQNWDDTPDWLYRAIQENGNSIRPLCSDCRQNERVLQADRAYQQHRQSM
jgi:hypothetical protein